MPQVQTDETELSSQNPYSVRIPKEIWEQSKITAYQVAQHGDCYCTFYIGFKNIDHAQIGIDCSGDGIGNWEWHPDNLIIRTEENQWDRDACYKPFVIFDNGRWLLWYNGRRNRMKQIGLVIHEKAELGF